MKVKESLKATLGNIKDVVIDVLDVFSSSDKSKNYILYLIDLDDENVYASVIEQKKDTIVLNPVTLEEEIKFIEKRIEKLKNKGDEVHG